MQCGRVVAHLGKLHRRCAAPALSRSVFRSVPHSAPHIPALCSSVKGAGCLQHGRWAIWCQECWHPGFGSGSSPKHSHCRLCVGFYSKCVRGGAVPKRAAFFSFFFGTGLKSGARSPLNRRWLQPTTVGWRPTAVGRVPSDVRLGSWSDSVALKRGATAQKTRLFRGGFGFILPARPFGKVKCTFPTQSPPVSACLEPPRLGGGSGAQRGKDKRLDIAAPRRPLSRAPSSHPQASKRRRALTTLRGRLLPLAQ